MHVHILGICGAFMGGVAALAKAAGHEVTGSDKNVYPPMSTALKKLGIRVSGDDDHGQLDPAPDVVVVGNVMSRGHPVVEQVLDKGIPYASGPEWLAENVLRGRWVMAVAGTHGKTTTSSILAWILEFAGLEPGFLIGGLPANFGVTARYGSGSYFVVEADEYDTAFFDKRAKFVHYHPRTLVLTNLEYDHADIYPDLESIKLQFHHLIRTVPGAGQIVFNASDTNLQDTLAMGCWSGREPFAADGRHGSAWRIEPAEGRGEGFDVWRGKELAGHGDWRLFGQHNLDNALSAVLAARYAGVPLETALRALRDFKGVRRRMELREEFGGVRVFDDFAHHPTEIERTIQALRAKVGKGRVIAVLEPRSNSMKMGVHRKALASALRGADRIWLYEAPGMSWSLNDTAGALGKRAEVCMSVDELVERVAPELEAGDHVLIMSNGDFGGFHRKLLQALRATRRSAAESHGS